MKNLLAEQVVGAVIERVIVSNSQVIDNVAADCFCSTISGKKIIAFRRRGKFMIMQLNDNTQAILHLRMTGCVLVTPPDYPFENHTHVVFSLDNDCEIRFVDPRRFGRWWLIKPDEDDIFSGIHRLGVEPFDEKLTDEYLRTAFAKRKKAIKACLLEQTVVAGIGNIYSDEILFSAGINPDCPANELDDSDWKNLAKLIPQRMQYFIEKNVVSPEEFLDGKGKNYRNTPFLQVYGHVGEPCQKCGTKLHKTVICGRSSVYCPSCQCEK